MDCKHGNTEKKVSDKEKKKKTDWGSYETMCLWDHGDKYSKGKDKSGKVSDAVQKRSNTAVAESSLTDCNDAQMLTSDKK